MRPPLLQASERVFDPAIRSFFNLVWLIANDFIVGVALASYVRDNGPWLKHVAEQLVRVCLVPCPAFRPHSRTLRSQVYVLSYLRGLLEWLSSWPMGIKLNDEVARVICGVFLFISELWENGSFLPVQCRSRLVADPRLLQSSSAPFLRISLCS